MRKPGIIDIVGFIGIFFLSLAIFSSPKEAVVVVNDVSYSTFLADVKKNRVESVVLTRDGNILVEVKEDISSIGKVAQNKYSLANPETDNTMLIGLLLERGVDIKKEKLVSTSLLLEIFISWFPMLLLIGLWVFFMRSGMGPGGSLGFGKSKAKMLNSEKDTGVAFPDVAGCDEAKEEVVEVVEFLKDPSKFARLGGKIPRGVLMVGSPGCGKTLLARAVAGEAKVPFFAISGSEFVEMFVGVGASRVRSMFENAKSQAPCIVFIDEIDAVGRHRGAGLGGGHDEREQTLNQLLVEMDGFESNQGIIVMAATNRPDVLDPALLRPGRFDRQVTIPLPDIKGREQILIVHMKTVPISENVNAKIIARGTPGFSGADLANLVNEAALMAARFNKRKVDMSDFEKAKDKMLMGVEIKSMIMSEEDKKITAYHEAGHCIVGRLTPGHDPVYKVSIIPRGRALGVTMFLPESDEVSMSKEKLRGRLRSLFGGRIAEDLIFGEDKVTTGASNDLERATKLARDMITRWGFSKLLGPVVYVEDEQEVFLGHSVTQTKKMSEATAVIIDQEVKDLIEENYAVSENILKNNMDILHAMADALLEYETITTLQIDDIMDRRPVKPIEEYEKTKAA